MLHPTSTETLHSLRGKSATVLSTDIPAQYTLTYHSIQHRPSTRRERRPNQNGREKLAFEFRSTNAPERNMAMAFSL